MIDRELRIGCVSDIHLGHPTNKTEWIIKNLNTCINCREFLTSIDVLFLAGDVFDRLLSLGSDEASRIDLWISSLIRNCVKYNVVLRILEGTPSHDRHQSVRFPLNDEKHQKAGQPAARMRYVDVLEIEYLEEFDIHVLYVPDEWGTGTDDALAQVRAKMAEKGLTQVDFAIMHGMFPHQLPVDIPNVPRHDPSAYHALVKYLIFIGHVHVFSTCGRIVAQGSFDRLAQGEEEPKGFVRALVRPSGDYELQFIENTQALKHITVVCDHEDVSEALQAVERMVRDLPAGSFVRIQAVAGHPILSNLPVVQERWPQFVWTLSPKPLKKTATVVMDHKDTYVPLVITRETILPIMQTRLLGKNYSTALISQCLSNLRSLL